MEKNNKYLEDKLEKMDRNTSLSDIQQYINDMIEIRGFTDETPQDIMLLMLEEVGELAKAVRKTTHIKMDINKINDYDITGEITDVFNYLLSLCRVLDIDLLEAFKEKEKRNCKRLWK